MNCKRLLSAPGLTMIVFAFFFLAPGGLFAHCDGMDGPVVKAAQKALEARNVNLVLVWVRKDDEAVIRQAFENTLAVRKLSPHAKELADRYFFETLVRIHRAGEGAPYTGLKPAGRDLGAAVPAADKALEEATVEPLVKLLNNKVERGLREQFETAMAKKNFRGDDVAAGREFVEAYVAFIRFAERVYEAAQRPAKGHFAESAEVGAHKE